MQPQSIYVPDEWADVPGFPGYQVSKAGVVRRLSDTNHLPASVLGGTVTDSGHRRYWIAGKWIDGHVAVLTAFVGRKPAGTEGCHNNGDALDNRLENLRWDTRQSNMIDKVVHGKHQFASRPACKRGHEFNEENTQIVIRQNGLHRIRVCRTCNRDRMRVRRAA